MARAVGVNIKILDQCMCGLKTWGKQSVPTGAGEEAHEIHDKAVGRSPKNSVGGARGCTRLSPLLMVGRRTPPCIPMACVRPHAVVW